MAVHREVVKPGDTVNGLVPWPGGLAGPEGELDQVGSGATTD